MRAVFTVASGARHFTGVALQALLIAVIVAALALALGPVYRPADFIAGTDSAAAAKGGRTAASLDASPHQVARGERFNVHGSGYTTGQATWVKVVTPTSTGYYAAGVDAAGNLSVGLELWDSGHASLTALQMGSNGRWSVMANCSVEVD